MKNNSVNRALVTMLVLITIISTAFTNPTFNNLAASTEKSDTLYRDSLIDKFVGTWVYTTRNLHMKLVLTKVKSPLGKSMKLVGQLNGGYVVIKNSEEVINTLTEKPLWGSSFGNQRICTLSIANKKSDKSTTVDLRFIDNDTIIIEKSGRHGEGIRFEEEHHIPLGLTLQRQK